MNTLNLFKIAFALTLIFAVQFAGAQTCPGQCVNLGGNPAFTPACNAAGWARGEKGCTEYANLGCVWQGTTMTPGRCVNLGGNPMFDGACSGAGWARGQQGCEEYANLGCHWQPGQCQ